MQKTILNHVAILVRSVDSAATFLSSYGFHTGPKETWDGEGTAEIYVGCEDQTAKLLLMEPVKQGAYTRAMEKRGPGLHHIAIDVMNLELTKKEEAIVMTLGLDNIRPSKDDNTWLAVGERRIKFAELLLEKN